MKLTVTSMRKVLQNVMFNPKEAKHLKVLVETGNREYYIHSAINTLKTLPEVGRFEAYIHAIRLIILAMFTEGTINASKGN